MKKKIIYMGASVAIMAGLTALPAAASHVSAPAARVHPLGSDSDPSVTSWATKCDFVAQRDIDPIGYHGATSAPFSEHHHIFFGSESRSQLNTVISDSTVNADLRGLTMQGNVPCKAPDKVGANCHPAQQPPNGCYLTTEKSLYWFPALYRTQSDRTNDVTTDPAFIFSYYRNEKVNPHDSAGGGTMTGLPLNMSMVGGNHDATTGQGTQIVEWSCIQGDDSVGGERTHQGDTIPNTCQYDTNLTGTSYLRVIVEFPNCLNNSVSNTDAFHNYTANFSGVTPDMKYAIANPNYPATSPYARTCPTGYHALPQVGIGVRWKLGSAAGGPAWAGCVQEAAPTANLWDCDTSHATLVSDSDTGLHGVTAHADFMNGWTQADMDTLMQQCFYRYSGNGDPNDPNNGNINCGLV